MEVISLEDARARGLKRYFTGTACQNGHSAERWVSSRSCVECLRERQAKWRATPEHKAKQREYDAKRYAKPEGRAAQLIDSARNRAKKKGLDFDLDAQWVAERIERGCAILGEPFNLTDKPPAGHSAHPRAPSLDRIDNSRGYTRDNVWLVCEAINRAKGSMPLGKFASMCAKVAGRVPALRAAGML